MNSRVRAVSIFRRPPLIVRWPQETRCRQKQPVRCSETLPPGVLRKLNHKTAPWCVWRARPASRSRFTNRSIIGSRLGQALDSLLDNCWELGSIKGEAMTLRKFLTGSLLILYTRHFARTTDRAL